MIKYLKWILGILFIYFLFKKKAVIMATYHELIKGFLSKEEGFSAIPYWDERQWTWGFGTKVPDSSTNKNVPPYQKSISRTDAVLELIKVVDKDKLELQKKIKIDLTINQWVALLSFSYNLGIGNAKALVVDINLKRWDVLKSRWLSFYNVKSNNQKLEGSLRRRRVREIELFFT